MKKFLLLIGVIELLVFFINGKCNASAWADPNVGVALEFENNTANSGNNGINFSNVNSIPFSNTIYIRGAYSIGPINSIGQHVISTSTDNTAYKTVQVWIYAIASGQPADADIWSDGEYCRLFISGGALYYYDPSASPSIIGPFTLTTGTWHLLIVNYSASNATLYIDGVDQGTLNSAHVPGYALVYYNLGNYYGNGNPDYCNCYLDNFVLSTDNTSGAEVSTVTPNVTETETANMAATETETQLQVGQTLTQAVIATETATVFTPTPGITVTLCSYPFPAAVLTPNLTPVLVASQNYEGGSSGSIAEPYVMYCAYDGLYHMSYTANTWWSGGPDMESICLATSSDLIHWTKLGPVIGGDSHVAGVTFPVGQSSQLHIGSEYRIYYSHETNKNVYYSTSSDGIHYTQVGYPGSPVCAASALQPPCTGSGGQLDGIGIFQDSVNNYWCLAEIISNQCPGSRDYSLWLWKDISGNATHFVPASVDPLNSLDPLYPNGIDSCQGSRGVVGIGSGAARHYYEVIGSGLQTILYLGESYDLYNWTVYPTPVVTPFSTMFGLTESTQAADSSVIEYNGSWYIFYDGTDNINKEAAIGFTMYPGTLAQFDDCGTLPSNTFTPTMTATPLPISWQQLNSYSGGTDARSRVGGCYYNNNLWIVGGINTQAGGYVDYVSTNSGLTWTAVTNNLQPLTNEALLSYNGYMYVIGGESGGNNLHGPGNNLADSPYVYQSIDGANWMTVTAGAPFYGSIASTGIVFNNKMWIIAGSNDFCFSCGGDGPAPGSCNTGSWWSTDGLDWNLATGNAQFEPRAEAVGLVYNNQMWIMGGTDGTIYYDDVWNSNDGITWNMVTGTSQTGMGDAFLGFVINNIMYVYVENYSSLPAKLWSSTDGITWTQYAACPLVPPNRREATGIFTGTNFVMAGGYRNVAKVDEVWNLGPAFGCVATPTPGFYIGSVFNI